MTFDITDTKFDDIIFHLRKAQYTFEGYERLFGLLAGQSSKTFLNSYKDFIKNYAENAMKFEKVRLTTFNEIRKMLPIPENAYCWGIDYDNRQLIVRFPEVNSNV